MKQLFALSLTIAIASPLAAQIQKGQSITSGTAGLSYSIGKNTAQTGAGTYSNRYQTIGVNAALNRAVFVKDGWALAYRIDVDNNRVSYDDEGVSYEGTLSTYAIGVAVGLRRYWVATDR